MNQLHSNKYYPKTNVMKGLSKLNNRLINNYKKYLILNITLFILLFFQKNSYASITFHSPESSIVLQDQTTQLAIIPDDIRGWSNQNIINGNGKINNIKTESNFIDDTLIKESAPTELPILNQNILTENPDDNLTQTVINNSNAIISNNTQIINNSNAIIKNSQEINHNSNAIIKLTQGPTAGGLQSQIDNLEMEIRYNSNAIITNDINVLQERITNNSNAIRRMNNQINQNSNSIFVLNNRVRSNSNAILTIETNSKQNSNSIITYIPNIKNNSQSIFTENKFSKQNSNAISTNNQNIINNSNLITTNNQQILYNSNAILQLEKDIDTTQLQNEIDINVIDIKNNSNAIIQNKENIDTNTSNISINDPKIDDNTDDIVINSGSLASQDPDITNNANNISDNIEYIKNNSDAIIKLTQGATPGGIEAQININTIKIRHNSNALIKISTKNSQTVLTESPITENITLQESLFINPEENIVIDENIILDGQGSVLLFGNSNEPQLIINPGKTVTLKNIQLLRINQQTFHLNFRSYLNGSTWSIDDAKIIIGENVVFGLSENITFSQGLIEIESSSEPKTFFIKGIEGQKQLTIDPSNRYSDALSKGDNGLTWEERRNGVISEETSKLPDRFTVNNTVPILLKSSNNILKIQNIKLAGFEHVSQSEIDEIKGKITLAGETELNIGNYIFNDFEINQDLKEECDKNFEIEKLNNNICLLKDDLEFTGELRFSNFGENSLEIKTMLTEKIIPKFDDLKRIIPQVNFDNNFMQLNSEFGLAKIIFSNNRIRIINKNSNSFVINGNAYLKGKSIEIGNNPIISSISDDKELIIELDQLIGLDDINNKPISFE